MKLYHGSIADIERTLTPHRAFDRWDYSPQVYLTDKHELALLYAINPISAYIKNTYNKDIHCSATSAHFCFLGGKVPTLIEMYPNMFEKTYLHKKAYIYVCEITKDVAYKKDGKHYTIDHEIAYAEKIEIADVLQSC